MNNNEVKTGETDDDKQDTGDNDYDGRCVYMRDAGKCSAETKTDWCR